MYSRPAAVAALLFLASALSSAQPRFSNAPDIVFFNGRIITVDPSSRTAEAFAVAGDRFIAVGSTAGMKVLAGPATRMVDLRGRTVVPGLIDNHNHQYHVALLTKRGVDLQDARSLADLLQRLRRAATVKPGETVFTTTGWNPDDFPEKRPPSRDELDAVASDRPIVVYASRGRVHVNSAALKVLGITRESSVVERVTVGKNASGEPDGVLNGSPAAVLNLTARVVPAPGPDEKKSIIARVQAEQHAMG